MAQGPQVLNQKFSMTIFFSASISDRVTAWPPGVRMEKADITSPRPRVAPDRFSPLMREELMLMDAELPLKV